MAAMTYNQPCKQVADAELMSVPVADFEISSRKMVYTYINIFTEYEVSVPSFLHLQA